MLVRNFAGGVVFSGDKVLLTKNEKDEWVLPRELMHNGELSNEVALKKIRDESGVKVQIISSSGDTNYEYYPATRQKTFCNKTTWYIMKSLNENETQQETCSSKFVNFFNVDEAMNIIGKNQDKSLINLSFKKYKEFAKVL
ncbi:MAG: NUDIX domain-containing protein [Clostridiaceae bacterium]|nr:NUDIX domain-containing protein [Clostridiaceae bacterium]